MNSDPEDFLIPKLVDVAVVGFDVRANEHVFTLSNGGTITSGGLWRLLAQRVIVATELDLGQVHWQPDAKPISVLVDEQMQTHLLNKTILAARVSVPTGDLAITLVGEVELQFIKLHSFLESWEVRLPGAHVLVDAWGRVNRW